jgi:hypothetical protein
MITATNDLVPESNTKLLAGKFHKKARLQKQPGQR